MSSRLTALASLGTAALALSLIAPRAAADTIVAADPGQSGTVVGQSTTPAASRTGPTAVASRPRTIVVTQHGGQPVALFADGLPVLRKPRPGSSPATFTGLRPGTAYTVIVGGTLVGKVTALDRPTPATTLVVRTADTPDSVVLSWRHAGTKATGGTAVTYDLEARSATAPTVSASVRRATTARLAGLDPTALYTFTVTPRNSAGTGTATTARMTSTLAQIRGQAPGVTPAPAPSPSPTPSATPTPTPTPAPAAPAPPAPAPAAPAPAPAPATVTVYVCPAGYAEVGGLCQKTVPYTYTVLPYTYHSVPVYGWGQIDWNYAWGFCSGAGTSGTWPNGDPYCRTPVYGDGAVVGSQMVRDATPAGYTDTGTNWQKRDPAPEGYLDNGTAWVKTVPKEARVVSA